jgi:type IV secretion system protein VirB10
MPETTLERTSAEGAGAPGMLSAQSGSHFNSVNGQREKRDFLHQQPVESDYLRTGRAAPISPFEVKAGTVIPGVMISGVNSDIPGQLVAQVSENVYDTATGRYLLIPQGAKLTGTYDNSVTFGQRRTLVVWRRIIYPDASSLDLGAMPGADESGYAGFKDKVDNHLLRLFSQAMLLSIFSAGIQLGSPQANSGANYNSSQIVAAAIAQQMGQLGMEVVRRNMDIAPTLEDRPGYIFNVMVTKDMVIRPWGGAGTAAASAYLTHP